ncbi:hypothetical protein AK830_g3482 [Neonectria ditissima]|uniref:Uncharacterized protein n=1 Tax=Neonectria ditissima TaxID=78410 RepID=A0A0P7B8T6_9HYPO|nr:hypothetical protein AK830_g3482 [Neonectria ditissima]
MLKSNKHKQHLSSWQPSTTNRAFENYVARASLTTLCTNSQQPTSLCPTNSDLLSPRNPSTPSHLSPGLLLSRCEPDALVSHGLPMMATMADTPESPRRRHILSAINPDRPRARDRDKDPEADPRGKPDGDADHPSDTRDAPVKRSTVDAASHRSGTDRDGETDKTQPRPSRLKLKDRKSRRRSSRDRDRDRDRHHDTDRPRSHRHRHRRRHRSPTPPDPYERPTLDPEAAFRESLFDAMADDEGASYWQGVYGQPVHVYSNEKVGPTGELEQMTEEEYATHVRQKMWEKTHAGLIEERAKRAEAKKRKEEEKIHNRKLQEEMERSLRRGEERRQRRTRAARWEEYTNAWSAWDGTSATLNWPIESGRQQDIDEKQVRAFFVHGLGLGEIGEREFAAKLKEERVRWHPDKMQQRLGGQVDEETMKDVTAIFQIIDRLWGEARGTG